MTPSPRLTTERLVLRLPELRDAASMQRLAGDRLIAQGTLTMPHPYEDGMAEEFITRVQDNAPEGKDFVLAIALKATDEFMVVIGLHLTAEYHRAEIGYWIGLPYWNQGYVTEAARAMMLFGFEEVGLNRICAAHFADNPASGRVMQKIGMTYEGTLRQHYLRFNAYKDTTYYGILREEWLAQQQASVETTSA